jgi:hypothetical protein
MRAGTWIFDLSRCREPPAPFCLAGSVVTDARPTSPVEQAVSRSSPSAGRCRPYELPCCDLLPALQLKR